MARRRCRVRISRDYLVLVLITATVAAVFVVGLWIPHRRDLASKQQQMQVAQNDLATHLATATKKPTIQAVPSGRTISGKKMEKAIPMGAELGDLLTQMGEDLQNDSVMDQQVKARAVVEGSDFNLVPLTLHFRGSYDALFDFLQQIESHERIIRIDRLNVHRDARNAEDAVVVDIELTAFFRSKSGGAT